MTGRRTDTYSDRPKEKHPLETVDFASCGIDEALHLIDKYAGHELASAAIDTMESREGLSTAQSARLLLAASAHHDITGNYSKALEYMGRIADDQQLMDIIGQAKVDLRIRRLQGSKEAKEAGEPENESISIKTKIIRLRILLLAPEQKPEIKAAVLTELVKTYQQQGDLEEAVECIKAILEDQKLTPFARFPKFKGKLEKLKREMAEGPAKPKLSQHEVAKLETRHLMALLGKEFRVTQKTDQPRRFVLLQELESRRSSLSGKDLAFVLISFSLYHEAEGDRAGALKYMDEVINNPILLDAGDKTKTLSRREKLEKGRLRLAGTDEITGWSTARLAAEGFASTNPKRKIALLGLALSRDDFEASGGALLCLSIAHESLGDYGRAVECIERITGDERLSVNMDAERTAKRLRTLRRLEIEGKSKGLDIEQAFKGATSSIGNNMALIAILEPIFSEESWLELSQCREEGVIRYGLMLCSAYENSGETQKAVDLMEWIAAKYPKFSDHPKIAARISNLKTHLAVAPATNSGAHAAPATAEITPKAAKSKLLEFLTRLSGIVSHWPGSENKKNAPIGIDPSMLTILAGDFTSIVGDIPLNSMHRRLGRELSKKDFFKELGKGRIDLTKVRRIIELLN